MSNEFPQLAATTSFAMLTTGLLGQAPALMDVNRVLPTPAFHSAVHAVGDVDGDGFLDVVFVGNAGGSRVWLGSASGAFTAREQALPIVAEFPRAAVLTDVDGDGDRDVVCAMDPIGQFPQLGYQGFDRIYLNDGTGLFVSSPAAIPIGYGASSSVAAADIDGDGDQDLVIGHPGASSWFGSNNEVLLNDGAGNFTADSQRLTTPGPGTNALVLFDHDGDGDADLYCGNTWGPTGAFTPSIGDQLFHNDGNGFFTPVPLTTFAGNTTKLVRAADFDGDGDQDVMTVESVPMFSDGVQYRRNDGTAGFTSFVVPVPAVPGPIAELLLGDWNADNRLDYAVRRNGGVHCYVHGAPGTFQASALPPIVAGDLVVLALDPDRDGDSDVIAPSNFTMGPTTVNGSYDSRWFRNLGTSWATLPPPPLPPLPIGTLPRAKLLDLDLDGDLDVIRSPHYTAGVIFLNTGTATFVQAPAGDFATVIAASGDLAGGDVDGDGDVDLVVTAAAQPSTPSPYARLFRNVNGTFVASSLGPVHGLDAALADLDGDGDLDAVLSDQVIDQVLWNDGTGAFTATPLAGIGTELSRPLLLRDLDNDGDVDIACYGELSGRGWFRNDGAGAFVRMVIGGMAWPGHVAAADFDLDQDVDLLIENETGTAHQLLRNDGTGAFTFAAVSASPGHPWRQLVPADIDADGWPDVIEVDLPTAANPAATSRVLHNDGAGGFTPIPGAFRNVPHDSVFAEPGDVDGDGDVDLLLAGQSATSLFRNLHHQLAWTTLPRVGWPLRLELFGRANEIAILGVAFAPAAIPIPGLGTLRLDPASLLIAAIGSYDAAGLGAFTLAVPGDPALVGASFWWQALSGAPAILGNVEVTTLQAR